MKRVVVNGANGFIASNFIHELLSQGYEVIALVRSENDLLSKQKMVKALKEVSNAEDLRYENLHVYNYALLETDFSLTAKSLTDIFGRDVDYFHFAANLKFSEKKKEEIFSTNVNGVENSIKVFLKYASTSSRFFFISTAYSCGNTTSVFEERFYSNEDISSFRNYYEQSKRYAENIIKGYIDNKSLNAYIIRPSQVVGNSKTGVTKTDFGIFDFTKRISRLAFRYPGESIRIKADSEATQNLIPIDTIVHYLMHTVSNAELPRIMNFVAKTSMKNSDIINCISDEIPITIIPNKVLERETMSSLERLLDISMSFTGHYCETNINFETTNIDKLITTRGNEITYKSLQMMIGYFIHNSQKNLKPLNAYSYEESEADNY